MKKKTLFFFTLLLYSFTLWAQSNPFSNVETVRDKLLRLYIRSGATTLKTLQLPIVSWNNLQTGGTLSPRTEFAGGIVYTTNPFTGIDGIYFGQGGAAWTLLPPDHLGNHIFTDLNMGNHNIISDATIVSKLFVRSNSVIYEDKSFSESPEITMNFQLDKNLVIKRGTTVLWTSNTSIAIHSAKENTIMNGNNLRLSVANDIQNNSYITLNRVVNSTVSAARIRVGNAPLTGPNFYIQSDRNLVLRHDNGNNSWQSIAPSDKRMKKNIRPMKKVLDHVLKMKLVEFKYKKGLLGLNSDSLYIGVIAQDIMKLFPRYTADFISHNSYYDRYYVNYRHLSVLALQAIKEFKFQHDEKINELKTKIKLKRKEDKMAQLKIKLEKINQRLDFLIEEIQEAQQNLYLSNKKTTNVTE